MIPADSLRAALDAVFRAPAYDWAREPEGVLLLRRWWAALQGWLGRIETGHPGTFRALIIGLALILAAILLHGVVVLLITVRGATASDEGVPAPAAARRTAESCFREADALAGMGRYAEAMRAAFVGAMLELDRRQVLSFHPGKTPADYVREARLDRQDRDALGGVVRVLYAVAFGGAPCPPEEYRRWRAALGESGPASAR